MRGDEDTSGQSKQRPCMPSLGTIADKASCGIDPLHPLHLTRARRSLRDDHDRRRRGRRIILPQGRGPELACYPEDKRCCWFHHHATHSHSHSGRFSYLTTVRALRHGDTATTIAVTVSPLDNNNNNIILIYIAPTIRLSSVIR